jgi:hypothetical protein
MRRRIANFPSAKIVQPAYRVREFVELAQRQIDVLISHHMWNDLVWSVGDSFRTKGQNRNNRILAFVNRDATISNRQDVTGEALHPAIIDFAKAYCRYLHATSPVTYENTRKRLDAIQLIEASFRQLGLHPAIENLNVVVLNTAVELAREGVGASRHYQFAICVQQVYRFCMDRQFLKAPFQWKHGVRKPKDRTEEIGQDAKEWREKKLPSPEAFHALAHVYRNAETFTDKLFSAVCAICIAIPIRAHEVLQLRIDCEVTGKTKLPDSGEEIETYGIRVWPGKNYPPQVKWVPTQMVDLVREAVGRLRDLCSEARQTSRWYEENPGKLWLPPEAEPHRASLKIPISDLWQILRHEPKGGKTGLWMTSEWARKLNIDGYQSGSRQALVAVNLASLTEKMLSRMPKEFPYFNGENAQRYSETLIVAFNNELTQHRPVKFVVAKVTVQQFEHWLSGHDNGRKPTVFERWGISETDGSPIKITTHAFRHWLNTVAQFRGLSDLDIAKWSGREVAQNRYYNHVSGEEMLSQIRQALDAGNAIGPMFEAARVQGVNQPVDRREFIEAQIGSALLSDFGICVHDYSLLPCQSFGDCLGCSENVFVKGDQSHREKINARLIITERQLAEALIAMGENYYGADKWVENHRLSIERMKQMLAVHDDLSIPDGTIVNLSEVSQDSAVAMAIRDRKALGYEEDGVDFDGYPDLADITATMGEE